MTTTQTPTLTPAQAVVLTTVRLRSRSGSVTAARHAVWCTDDIRAPHLAAAAQTLADLAAAGLITRHGDGYVMA